VAWTPDGLAAVVYYDCSVQSGARAPCPASDDELVLAWRIDTSVPWQKVTVDTAGGYFPKLAYLSDGRAVVAYRDPSSTVLKLAIQH
jgi:hypothetical protein